MFGAVEIEPYNANNINYSFRDSLKCAISLSLKYIHKQIPLRTYKTLLANFLYHVVMKFNPREVIANYKFTRRVA